MSDLVLHDRTLEHDGGAATRTMTVDLPKPWVLHALFRSELYVSHTRGNATIDVALATDDGYAVAMIVPSDGVPTSERSFDDYFSGGPTRPHDKAALTFRADVHDADAVIPAVRDVLEEIRPTYEAVAGANS